MYRISARQLILIALVSAIVAAGAVLMFDRYGARLMQPSGGAAYTESAPAGITNPTVASDEQNNIEVYKTISPGVVFITSTSVQPGNLFFDEQERDGSGSGSIIDSQGHILTNYHVIEGAQKLTVSFGGDKSYPAQVVGADPDTDLAVI